MKAKITVRSIPGFTPKEKPYEIADHGLVLRVQPSGVVVFYAVYRINGKNIRYRIGNAGHFTIGSNDKAVFVKGIHPDVARTVLKEKAGEALQLVKIPNPNVNAAGPKKRRQSQKP